MGALESTESSINKDITTTSVSIYVLELEKGKYYVGRTENMNTRYRQHLDGKGSEWTKTHKPVKILREYKNSSVYDEDKTVIEFMDKFGIDNVRGGSYSSIMLKDEDIHNIQKHIWSANDKCFNCGGDHFVKFCTKNKKSEQHETPQIKSIKDKKVNTINKYESVTHLSKIKDVELYNKLIDWRTNNMEYFIKDSILKDVAYYKPRNLDDIKRIRGIGDKICEKYGDDILKIIGNKYDNILILTNEKDILLYKKIKKSIPSNIQVKDSTLKDLAYYKPKDLIELSMIRGIGKVKLEKYNDKVLDIINNEDVTTVINKVIKHESIESLNDADLIIFNNLLKWRTNNIDSMLTDTCLRDLSHYKPKNIKELKTIKGIGNVKSDRYGNDILKLLLV